jgi:predicted nucleic acid-binding protein
MRALLRRHAVVAADPTGWSGPSAPDPGDDYLIALAATSGAALVSGDAHLLGLAEELPVFSPAAFLKRVGGDQP